MTHGLDTSFLVAVEILEHPRHGDAWALLRELLAGGGRFSLAPQVLAEFVHTVTDPRRFQTPLSMEVALGHSARWWNATEVDHWTRRWKSPKQTASRSSDRQACFGQTGPKVGSFESGLGSSDLARIVGQMGLLDLAGNATLLYYMSEEGR